MSGWIKLHRKLTEWEWYSDVNTSRVFMHLLLVANHKDNQWRGISIKRGQRLTSISKLADETNLSIKNIRTSIKRLKATNEVASHSNAQHTVFTIVNYDLYQQEASEVASEGQAKGKQVATNKNVKNDNNEDNKDPLVKPEVKQVIDHLNQVVGSKYKSTTKSHSENINARLKDHSVDELKAVIDFKFKEWGGDPKMAAYIRPGTLFQAGKFDGYLLASRTVKQGGLNIDTSKNVYESGAL